MSDAETARSGHALGVKDWEPLLLLPEPPARCSCPGCPAGAPLGAEAADEDLLQACTQGLRGASIIVVHHARGP